MVYLHILDKYQVSKVALGAERTLMCELTLPPLKQKIVSSKPLSGGSVKVSQDNQAVRILILPNEMDPIDTIVELTLDGPITGRVEKQSKTTSARLSSLRTKSNRGRTRSSAYLSTGPVSLTTMGVSWSRRGGSGPRERE